MEKKTFWQTKLAARIHDPAEKALVLLRDPEGHEGGTSKALARLLGLTGQPSENVDPDNADVLSALMFKKGLPKAIYRHIQRADWWAAAADRPQWPMEEITLPTGKALKVAPWARVNWASKPVLIHPLTADQLDLGQYGGLSDTDFQDIRQKSFDHFSSLLKSLNLQGDNLTESDLRKILLTWWRFGPELTREEADNGKLGLLWGLLPADTRIPDHTIWDHLDLTSAFAGAFAADPKGEAALLSLSIGPVQSFIAAARSTSDLWAGSHLLSRLAWEAMRPVCEELGPDAILFPRLRGIPQVDLWLRDQMDLPDTLFKDCDWAKGNTDANPLFSAALPNRFVAVVPASQVEAITQKVTTAVRQWLKETGEKVLARLLDTAGFEVDQPWPCYDQLKEQLAGFPEVYWAAVPFSLIQTNNLDRQTDLDTIRLSETMAPFFGVEPGQPCGFLATPAWEILHRELAWQGDKAGRSTFFAPNPGVLYPAVYDLAERVMAAAKSTRPFAQTRQEGWRCSLTGETEWLTTDRAQLQKSYRQQNDTLWAKVAKQKPSWAKKGEHLGALPAIKRLWPTLFAEEVGRALNTASEASQSQAIQRFVVSTHTMALASQLNKWLERVDPVTQDLADSMNKVDGVALPRKLIKNHFKNQQALELAKRIPGLLESARDSDDEQAYENARRQVKKILSAGGEDVLLETYYALIMMDGDRMGAILSGDEKTAISYLGSFHPAVRDGFNRHAGASPQIQQYGSQKRAISPNRHLAVSGALNDFSQTVVRHVVEEEHLGRVIYAGGDDVLAMLPVADLLKTMQRLREAYSGTDTEHEGDISHGLNLQKGFALIKTRQGDKDRLKLMRMMGKNATASCGAVIAHHQAPLSAVMCELRAAEKRAKDEGGRNAFSITVIKRSGGALRLTEQWGEPVRLLEDLIKSLSDEKVSRRAVYNTLNWIHDLPDPNTAPDLLASLLGFQFARQGMDKETAPKLARRLAALTASQPQPEKRLKWLENFLTVAEFLAREIRNGGNS